MSRLKIAGTVFTEVETTEASVLDDLISNRIDLSEQYLDELDGEYYIVTRFKSIDVGREVIDELEYKYILSLLTTKSVYTQLLKIKK